MTVLEAVNDAPINYAKAVGIESFPLAVLFCIIYIPLFLVFTFRWFKNMIYVLGAVALFSIIRITAFGMRAAFTKSDSLSQNKNMIIAQSIIYSIGYFGVLSSAINLVIDRDEASGTNNRDPLRIVSGNRHLMRMILTGAVVMGIIGSIDSQNSSNTADKIKTGNMLRKISVIVYLTIAILLIIHTAFSVMAERKISSDEKTYEHTLGHTHGMKILLVTGAFLALREAFYVVTMNNLPRQEEEKLFYPFAATTELIAVLTFLIPGLVPPKHTLPR